MKTYRQREKQGSKVQESNKGPDEAKIKVRGRHEDVKIVCDRCPEEIVVFGVQPSVAFSCELCFRLCWSGQATPWMSPRARESMEAHLLTMCSQEHTQE